MFLEVAQVLVHAARLIPSHETADRIHAEQHRRIEHAQHELALLAPDGRIVMQQVVEVGEVGQLQAGPSERMLDASRPGLVEPLPQIERIGHRIEHRVGRDVHFRRVRRRGELHRVGAKPARELNPVLDRAIRIRIADLARGQLLESRSEDANLHEGRLERAHRHITIVREGGAKIGFAYWKHWWSSSGDV